MAITPAPRRRLTGRLPPLLPPRAGLRPRLFLAFLLATLLPLGLLSSVVYQKTRAATMAQARGALERVSQVQQRRLNGELRRLGDNLALVASRTQMRISLQRFGASGDPAQRALLERILADALAPMAAFAGIWVRDTAGRMVTGVTVEGRLPVADPVPPPFVAGGEPLALAWGSAAGPYLWVSGPLDLEGEPVGSVHILARIDDLVTVLQDFSHERVVGRTVLLVAEGDHPVRPFSGSTSGPSACVGASLEGEADFPTLAPGRGLAAPLTAANRLLWVRPLDYAVGHVLVELCLDELDRVLAEQLAYLALAACLAVGLSVALALLFARMIARPVEVLTRATRDLHADHEPVPLEERFWGEFTELTESFNYAMTVIGEHTRALTREVEAHRRSQQQLSDLANSDPLTGLFNRRYFMQVLDELLCRREAPDPRGALLYLDLDHFKPINDRLGHEAGDVVLQAVAGRLRHLVRDRDLAARIGGDEFALLLFADAGRSFDPAAVARRAELQVSRPLTVKDRVVRVGCSVGVTLLLAGDEPQGALNRADEAMYRVKSGRRAPVP